MHVCVVSRSHLRLMDVWAYARTTSSVAHRHLRLIGVCIIVDMIHIPMHTCTRAYMYIDAGIQYTETCVCIFYQAMLNCQDSLYTMHYTILYIHCIHYIRPARAATASEHKGRIYIHFYTHTLYIIYTTLYSIHYSIY